MYSAWLSIVSHDSIQKPLAANQIMKNRNYLGLGIALSAGVGTAIGVAMNNVAMGIGLGTGIGLVIVAGIVKKSKNKDDKEN